MNLSANQRWMGSHTRSAHGPNLPRLPLNSHVFDCTEHLLYSLSSVVPEPPIHFFPLILFGPAGVGKSSLAESIAATIAEKQRFEVSEVAMFSASEFRRRFVTAIKTNSVDDFRCQFNSLRIVVIDGIDQLKSSEQTQCELIRLLDQSHRSNKYVIFTSRELPNSAHIFLPQLASRLSFGLMVPIEPPSEMSRFTIARNLAELMSIDCTDTALKNLVCRVRGTALDLYRTLLGFNENFPGQSLTDDTINSLYPPLEQSSASQIDKIARLVSETYQIRLSEIRGKTRRQAVVDARSIAMYLSRQFLGLSYQRIGNYFSKRDHSTVRHAIQQVKAKMNDNNYAMRLNELTKKISSLTTSSTGENLWTLM